MKAKLAATCAALFLATAAAAFAQQPRSGVEDVTVRTADGWTLPVTYYRSDRGKETPVVILLHGEGGNRQVWKGLATRLHGAGYAVAAVDLRKHGDSQAPLNAGPRAERLLPTDYPRMAFVDLQAVKDFLLEKHQDGELNIRKTAIVAADDTAPVAANFALADWLQKPYPDAPTFAARTPRGQDVRALVLLSPSEGAGTLNLGQALPRLRGVGLAAWIAVGAEDREDKGAAEKAYEQLTSGAGDATKRVFLDTFDQVKARGTELFTVRNANVEGRILNFLDEHLKPLDGPNDKWRDRKSRLE